MTFDEALKLMRQGKMMQRRAKGDSAYAKANKKPMGIKDGELVVMRRGFKGGYDLYPISSVSWHSIVADDWEVYK